MSRMKYATALVTAAAVVTVWGAAFAAEPTQADFDACNREAQALGSPSASPGAPSTGTTSSGMGAGRASDSSGSVSTSASGPGGTTTSTITPGGATTSTAATPRGDLSSSSTSDDRSLAGIAPAGKSDPAYQQAYRDCLKRRGF